MIGVVRSYVEEKGRAPSREKAQKIRPVPVKRRLSAWDMGDRTPEAYSVESQPCRAQ